MCSGSNLLLGLVTVFEMLHLQREEYPGMRWSEMKLRTNSNPLTYTSFNLQTLFEDGFTGQALYIHTHIHTHECCL